jgi:transposase
MSITEAHVMSLRNWKNKLVDMRNRGDLTNEQWEQIELLLPKAKMKRGRPAQDHRQLLNGILWVLRSGANWLFFSVRSAGPINAVLIKPAI